MAWAKRLHVYDGKSGTAKRKRLYIGSEEFNVAIKHQDLSGNGIAAVSDSTLSFVFSTITDDYGYTNRIKLGLKNKGTRGGSIFGQEIEIIGQTVSFKLIQAKCTYLRLVNNGLGVLRPETVTVYDDDFLYDFNLDVTVIDEDDYIVPTNPVLTTGVECLSLNPGIQSLQLVVKLTEKDMDYKYSYYYLEYINTEEE